MMILIERRTRLVCPERKKGVQTVKKIADVGAKTAARIPSQMEEEGFLLKCHLNRVRDTMHYRDAPKGGPQVV